MSVMMRPSLRFLPVLPLLMLTATHAAPAPLQQLAAWEKQPAGCKRAELLGYLRSEDLRVRSAALDLLESVTGRNFGLDPWLPPAEVPAEVVQQLEAWAAAEQGLGKPGEKADAEQLRHAVALLRDADPDTLRRTCLRFAGQPAGIIAALQRELAESELAEHERDHLKLALYRIQLQGSMGDEAGRAAGLLASHARNDQLDGLEMLRKAGPAALPVAACFVEAEDGLLRETAVDVFLQLGKTQAFLHLLPALEKDVDRNILQMAARRAMDCGARAGVIRFLNHCAASEDEDVSVAGLDALRELRLDNDDEEDAPAAKSAPGEARDPAQLASRADALPVEQFVALTRSPHWRVRAAAIGMMESKSVFLPSSANKEVAAAIIAALDDDDETVRQTALRVMYRRGLSSDKSLEAFAHRNPASAPFAVYLFARNSHQLSEGMCELVRRFSPAQVDELFAYEEEFDDVFTDDKPGATAKRVLALLGENPDPAVTERLVYWTGALLFVESPARAALVMDWLESPDVLREEKARVVQRVARSLRYARYESHSEQGNEREEGGFGEVDTRFRTWLEAAAQEEGSLGSMALVTLASLDATRAAAIIDARLAALPEGKLPPAELVEEVTTESELMSKLAPESILRLMQHEDCRWTAFSALVKGERGLEMLRSAPLSNHMWYDIVLRELDEDLRDARLYPRHSTSLADMPVTAEEKAAASPYEVYGLEPWVVPLLDHYLRHAEPASRRAEVAFLLLCRRPVLELDEVARALGTLAKAEEVFSAADAEYARCIAELPCRPEEVAPWAERHAGSAHPFARLAVAGCLLPCSVPRFLLPLPEPPPGQCPFLKSRCPMSCLPELKRVSCPRELIELVRGMQADKDPHVALMACASMLYRTGDCDRERFLGLLRQLQQQFEADGEEMNYEYYSLIRDQLNGAWERWSDYRRGVTEPFKLKGSPKRIPDSLIPLLVQLHRVADNSWNLQADLRKKLRTLAGEGDEGSLPPGSPLTFNSAAGGDAPPADTPPAGGEGSAVADAADATDATDATETPSADDRPPVAADAPFRVEYFHRRGCDTCERVARELEELRRSFPGMEVVDHAIESEAGYERNEVLCSRFGVPTAQRHKAPILFAESGYLMGEEIGGSSLRSLLEASRQKGEARKLAASPKPKEERAEPPPAGDAPAATPPPAQPDLLAETSATEAAAAESTAWWEALRRYGVLALGGLVALLALLLVLFNRPNKNDKPES